MENNNIFKNSNKQKPFCLKILAENLGVGVHFRKKWDKNIIDQKGGENAWFDSLVSRKKNNQTFWVLDVGSWTFVIPLGFKNTIDYRSKKLKNCSRRKRGSFEYLWYLLRSNSDYIIGQKSWSEGRSWVFVLPFGIKITIVFRPNDNINIFLGPKYHKQFERMLDIMGVFFQKKKNRLSIEEGGEGGGWASVPNSSRIKIPDDYRPNKTENVW